VPSSRAGSCPSGRSVTAPTDFRVEAASARRAGRLHDPDDPYVEDVWLPVIGPAAYVVWRQLARRAAGAGHQTVSIPRLAAAAGLGRPLGNQSPIRRALRRLERFGLVHLEAERILVRPRLPYVTGRQLALLDPETQAIHHLHRDRAARTA
jgi:hypothetical protein